MDVVDLQILGLLQQDSSLTLAEVAAQVNLSPTPCWRRIAKLEESGVIARRVALLDAAKVGIDLTIFVTVRPTTIARRGRRASPRRSRRCPR